MLARLDQIRKPWDKSLGKGVAEYKLRADNDNLKSNISSSVQLAYRMSDTYFRCQALE
jgi:hypothetical protein